MTTVGVYQARNTLPKLLDRVAQGETITITRSGKVIAQLVPPPGMTRRAGAEEAVRQISAWRERHSIALEAGVTVKDLINEGRKY